MNTNHRLEGFYTRITAAPKLVLFLGFIFLMASAFGLFKLHKDTTTGAFIPDDHPSLIANEIVRERFGLADSIAVAVVLANADQTVFTPQRLMLIETLSVELADIDNLREDRVASIATESSISGAEGAVNVDSYLPYFESEQNEQASAQDLAAAQDSRMRWSAMVPHRGTLVSEDGRGAIIMAEMLSEDRALDTYLKVQALIDQHESVVQELGMELLIAGPGAVSGYFNAYVGKDASRLLPISFLFVLGFVYLAFLRSKALVGPVLIILASVGGAIGIMGWLGVDYYAITNSLPVILVAIAVADSIHVLSAYYTLQRQHPTESQRSLVIASMCEMTRPVVLTTLTTMAGFIGLALVSIMPPISYFALFAALGVALACLYTMLVLPSVLVLLQLKPSPAFVQWENNRADFIGRGLLSLAQFSRRFYEWVLTIGLLLAIGAVFVAVDIRIDRSQVENFSEDEPLRLADERINQMFVGTAFLNLVVTAKEPQGLLGVGQMRAIAQLQDHFEALPHVQKSISIVDYLAILHAAINETPDSGKRTLPPTDDAIAQYLLVYEASGSPTDFEEEIDAEYQSALIRGFLNVHRFSESQPTVAALQAYIHRNEQHYADLGIAVTLAGDVNITYHWMTRLTQSHFAGIGLALFLVFTMGAIMFRSPALGLLAVTPVAGTVLSVYGVMSALDIALDPPTSMFATIAIGVGVDFSIHLIDRVRGALEQNAGNLPAALDIAVPGTARACLFNALALAVGFSVLMISLLPTLQRFGGFIALAAVMSFLASLIVIPAGMAGLDRLKTRVQSGTRHRKAAVSIAIAPLMMVGLLAAVLATTPVEAANERATARLDGLAVATQVQRRTEGQASRRNIDMQLIDKRGKVRAREALVMKQRTADARLTRITYLKPKPVREVTFLSHDSNSIGGSDSRWLYLPATGKVRRIPASDRGDYFLGTDFTYEDMQSELKFDLADYNFDLLDGGEVGDDDRYRLRGVPKSKAIARELGYGGFTAEVDASTWMPMRIDFIDVKSKPLKTVTVFDVTQLDGIWTVGAIECANVRTGHTTRFTFRDTEYVATLEQRLFQANALARGMPKL